MSEAWGNCLKRNLATSPFPHELRPPVLVAPCNHLSLLLRLDS